MLDRLAEFETRSAAARLSFRAARADLARASTPSNILGAGFAAVTSSARMLMPEALRITSQKAGVSLANMAIGAIGTFLASKFASKISKAQPAPVARLADAETTDGSDAVQPAPKNRQTARGRLGAIVRTAAAGALAWYVGHVLSRQLRPTAFERQLVDRYGKSFADFIANTKADLPQRLLRSSGLAGKASSALIAFSAIAALIKEFDGSTEAARGNAHSAGSAEINL